METVCGRAEDVEPMLRGGGSGSIGTVGEANVSLKDGSDFDRTGERDIDAVDGVE